MTDYIKKLDYKFEDIEKAWKLAANLQYAMDKHSKYSGEDLFYVNIAEAFLLLFANWGQEHLPEFGSHTKHSENNELVGHVIDDFLYSIGMCKKQEHGDEEYLRSEGFDREEWKDIKHNYFLKFEYQLPWYHTYDGDINADLFSSYLTPKNREDFEKAERERFDSLTQREQFYEMFEDGYIGDGVRVEDLSFDDDDEFDKKI